MKWIDYVVWIIIAAIVLAISYTVNATPLDDEMQKRNVHLPASVEKHIADQDLVPIYGMQRPFTRGTPAHFLIAYAKKGTIIRTPEEIEEFEPPLKVRHFPKTQKIIVEMEMEWTHSHSSVPFRRPPQSFRKGKRIVRIEFSPL